MVSSGLSDLRLHSPWPARAWGPILSSCAVLILIGCSHGSIGNREGYSASGLQTATQNSAATSAPHTGLEADGLPAQYLPPAPRRSAADDPAEPFSPNYGQDLPLGTTSLKPLRAKHVWRKQFSPAKIEEIVSRAVVEHELRQQAAETGRF